MGDYVDFKQVKAAASLESVARWRYGVVLRRMNGSHERGKCPLPSHPAGDDAKSFSVNTQKGVWICHSTVCAKYRRGKKGGDVIEFVAIMESCSLRDAGLMLAGWFGIDSKSNQERDKPVELPANAREPHDQNPSSRSEAGERYGIYDPLAEWIEVRAAQSDLSPFERSAFLSVLGQIETLARGAQGGAS